MVFVPSTAQAWVVNATLPQRQGGPGCRHLKREDAPHHSRPICSAPRMRRPASTARQANRASNAADRRRKSRVLVVDDHPAARTGICEILTVEGFEAVHCASADEALSILRGKAGKRIGLALLDLQLPGLDGIRLLECVRDHAPNLPVIIYTGEGCYESARQALNAGAFAYLEKGEDPQHLIARVREALLPTPTPFRRKPFGQRGRETQATLDRITDAIPGAVYRYQLRPSGEQRFLYVSYGIERLLGLTAEETLRDFARVWSLGHPDDLESLLQSIQESARTLTPWNQEFRVIVGGRIKWLRGSSIPEAPYPNGSIVWNGILIDITERKVAEEALRFARFATDRAADCVYWMTHDAKFFYVNDAACQSLGYSRNELLSMSVHDIDPNYPAEAWPAFWEKLRMRGSVDLESRIRRKSGEFFPVEIKTNYLQFEGKEFNCSIVRDLTQRKRAEAALEETRSRLLHQQQGEKRRIEEELDKARGTLVRQTRLAALGQLLGSMAHELRNPLAMIRNASYLLKRRLPPTDQTAAEYLNMIDCEVDASIRLIHDLQSLSRGSFPDKNMIDLGRQINEAKLRAHVPAMVTCRVIMQPNPFEIYADSGQVQQVLVNLLSNACQAMRQQGNLTIRASRARGWDVLTIRDSGPGVPEDHRLNIFEPLFTTKLNGFGLGLTICRHIVEQHGGSIELLEFPREGAVFEIKLPRPATR